MLTKEGLSAFAGVLFVVGFVPYIRAILRGETKPAKASWVIWASLDTITMAGMYAEHTVNGQIVGATIGAWLVAILAMMWGASGWTRLDKFCLSGGVLGIILWQTFSNPVLGIAISLGTGFLASFPTFVSAFNHPEHEDRIAWTIFWLSCVTAVIAIPQWTLADAAQPLTFMTIETTMMFLLFLRPRLQIQH